MALRLTNVNLQRPNSQCTFERLKNLLLYKKKAIVGSQSFNNICTSVSLPQHLQIYTYFHYIFSGICNLSHSILGLARSLAAFVWESDASIDKWGWQFGSWSHESFNRYEKLYFTKAYQGWRNSFWKMEAFEMVSFQLVQTMVNTFTPRF